MGRRNIPEVREEEGENAVLSGAFFPKGSKQDTTFAHTHTLASHLYRPLRGPTCHF